MWSRKIVTCLKSTCNIQKIVRGVSQAPQRKLAPETNDIHSFKVGQLVHGFEVKEIKDINEFRLTAIYLVHAKTKAEYLHLYRNDSNNVFSINFRTTPMNSTGLPHILEHTVLCGSELFPVRDPFFKMLNRSLATFMNAMTGSDYTMYPFSSQNYSDYRNLQRIYLDAVFRPNLNELDFMQEGWRLENVDPHDPKTDLIIKGIVYNEMKGVFSENENVLAQKLQNLILPDHTYGIVSGGDPADIPNLTWQDLKDFHYNHYHPSNCRFYSYGNFPLAPSLEYVNGEYLEKCEYLAPKHTEVPPQKRWSAEKREHISSRFENMREPIEKQNTISVSLLLADTTNFYETFLMQFLTELLIRGPNSPFYKSLIEPNISGGYTPSTGFDAQPRDCIFTIGLQGLKQEDFGRIVDLYNKTIDDVIKSGFRDDHIESVLHRYELSLKHETRNFGLNLLFGISATWNHTNDVINALQVNALIEKLRAELKDKSYLQKSVQKYFKDNKHRLILSMSPDLEYEKKLEVAENALIKRKVKELTDSEKKGVFNKCLELQKQQVAKQDTDLLPTLLISDISSDVERVPKEDTKIHEVQTQVNQVSSNGVVYFKSLLNILDLSQEQQMLLPLFCSIISKLGTDKCDYREFDNLVNTKSAGLGFHNHIGESLYHLHTYEPAILISSYCLEKNLDSMFDLWSQIFNISELKDVKRFQMLVQLYMSNLTHGIADAGHMYAMQAAAGLVSGSAYQTELLSGLHHIAYMKRLVHTSNYQAMLDEICNIAKILFDRRNMRVALNISPDNQPAILQSYETFLKSLPTNTSLAKPQENSYVTGKVWAPNDAVNCEHYILNIPVNYCSKAVLTAPYADTDYAKLRVLAKLLSSKYLHPELREKQGAYGGGARLTADGVFSFYSYRDPRNVETLDVFDESHKWLKENLAKATDQDVFEAKLGVFQAVDAPIPPSAKGCDEFLRRLTPDVLQRHRAEIMAVDKEGLRSVGEKYLGSENVVNTGKVILGPKSDKTEENSRPDELWTVVDSV